MGGNLGRIAERHGKGPHPLQNQVSLAEDFAEEVELGEGVQPGLAGEAVPKPLPDGPLVLQTGAALPREVDHEDDGRGQVLQACQSEPLHSIPVRLLPIQKPWSIRNLPYQS
jgi:hypothetical protein